MSLTVVDSWGGDPMPEGVRITPSGGVSFALSKRGARLLTDSIKRDLGSLRERLRQAREGGADVALGYPDWHTYCQVEFGNLRDLALPIDERRALVASMRKTDPPTPTEVIAERLGVSVGTVQKDRVAIDDPADRPQPRLAKVVPIVERDYSGLSRLKETLLRVRDQGDRGLTSIELDLETAWPMGTATGRLSELAKPSRGLVETSEHVRLNRRAYVITEKGRAMAAQLDAELST